MDTENPVNDATVANEDATIPDMSSIDTQELLEKLKRDIAHFESLRRSLATSIDERHAEILNHDPSDEATARRRPMELDSIVEGLLNDDLQPGAPWGFVVFRTVYGPESDAPFARMMEQLRDIDESLSAYKQQYLAPHYELTVIEDEKTLAGADSHTVRNAFRAWVAEDLTPRFKDTEKWGGDSEVRRMLRSNVAMSNPSWTSGLYHPATLMPTRWQFCLFVDETCLRSLVEADGSSGPYVKLLTTDWEGDRAETIAEGWEDGTTDDENEDVGWMYMDVDEHVETYRNFMDQYSWWEVPLYQRPYKGFIPWLL